MPMITSVIIKSQELSIAVEMRGFRARPQRTSLRMLSLKTKDYLVMVSVVALTLSILTYYFIGA